MRTPPETTAALARLSDWRGTIGRFAVWTGPRRQRRVTILASDREELSSFPSARKPVRVTRVTRGHATLESGKAGKQQFRGGPRVCAGELGVSRRTVIRHEHGEHRPQFSLWERLRELESASAELLVLHFGR